MLKEKLYFYKTKTQNLRRHIHGGFSLSKLNTQCQKEQT